MKIIKKPDPVKCEICGCVFEFDEKDIRTDYYLDSHASPGLLPTMKQCIGVRCPMCNELHIIKEC